MFVNRREIMSRRKLQSNNSQYELRKHKAIIYRTFVALICLTAAGAAVALLGGYISRAAAQGTTTGIWEDVAESSIPNRGQRGVMPRAYRILRLNKDALRALLADAPMEFTREANAAPVTISLPMPDGTFGRFKVVESPMMEAQLAAKHPDYKTYSGTGVDDPAAITRFGITASGFHAIILAPSKRTRAPPAAAAHERTRQSRRPGTARPPAGPAPQAGRVPVSPKRTRGAGPPAPHHDSSKRTRAVRR
jgi:hypothetical protein